MTAVERVADVLADHEDEPGWMRDSDDRLVYECLCGDRSPAIDNDGVYPEDVEWAADWHRSHLATALVTALRDDREGETVTEWGLRAEDGRTCLTNEETAQKAVAHGGWTLDSSPIVAVLTRQRTPDVVTDWSPVTPDGGDQR